MADITRQIITPIAVPFFFTASGFLSRQKLGNDFKVAIVPVKNNYIKYIIWSAIYFPFVIFGWIMSENSILQNVIGYVRNFIFEGSYLTIWFLNALAFALLLEHLLLKKFKSKTVFFISLPLFAINLLLSSYNQLLTQSNIGISINNIYYFIFETTKNGVLFGLPYVSLGVWLSEIDFTKIKVSSSLIGVLITFVLLICEVLLRNRFLPNNKSVDFCIFHIPLSYNIIQFAVALENTTYHKNNYQKGVIYRKLSILIFLTQRIFIFAFDILNKILATYLKVGVLNISFIQFILVAGCTILFSIIVLRLGEKYKWIKNLY